MRSLRRGFRRIWPMPQSPAVTREDGAHCRGALVDALMRPGGVVVLLVLGQDGPQVRFAENEAAIEELAPQRADEALAGRVHPRRLDGGARNGGAGGLEDSVEGAGEVRPAVREQEPEAPEPLAEVHGQVAGLPANPVAWGRHW